MYAFCVGIDVSKSTIDVSYCKDREVLYLSSFLNEVDGFKDMVKLLRSKTESKVSEWLICFENTGVYSKSLLEWLCSMAIPCKEENPLQISKSMGIRRGKDDRIDSKKICQYAFEKRDIIDVSKLTKSLIINLQKLLRRRELLIKQKVALEVSLTEQKIVMAPTLLALFNEQNESLLGLYQAQLKQIEEAIKEVINEDEQTKQNS